MSEHFCAFNHKAWTAAGLKDYEDLADCVEYVNQAEYGDGFLEGEWYYPDTEALVIYSGSFGNYNSPGADNYTYADRYETWDEFSTALAEWEQTPEYVEQDDDSEYEDIEECPICGQNDTHCECDLEPDGPDTRCVRCGGLGEECECPRGDDYPKSEIPF